MKRIRSGHILNSSHSSTHMHTVLAPIEGPSPIIELVQKFKKKTLLKNKVAIILDPLLHKTIYYSKLITHDVYLHNLKKDTVIVERVKSFRKNTRPSE